MLFFSFFITTAILGFCSSCSENEMDTECVNPCNTCEQKGQCDPPPTCQPGCDCKPGYYRDESGYCVPKQQCAAAYPDKTRCPKNAAFNPCSPSAVPTCENPYPEPDYETECVPGCVCRQGFLKRKDGQCVPPDQCEAREEHAKENPEPKCPKNAIFIKCGSACPPTCDEMQPEPCEEKCTTACYCKPGYLKRKDGVCVRPIECHPNKKPEKPAHKCPENAIYIECGSPCPPTCEDRLPVCEEKCTKACYCKPGFLLKTDEAKCVKPDHCGTKHIPETVHCPVNEEPSDCVIPCNDCKIKGSCKYFACKKGCDCKRGYYRNKDGKCILASECPKTETVQCPANEEPSDCVIPCNDCKIKGSCKYFTCKKGCDCKRGYYRNKDGKCIPASECPKIESLHCPANEEPSDCVIPCNDCKIKGNCRYFDCKKGCECKRGYYRNKDRICVPASECSKIVEPQPKCATDEQFYECTPSCKNACENIYNHSIKCQCGPPGCFCKDGLVKRKDGKCVPPEQCEVKRHPECGPDEQFYECKPSCKNTCDHYFNPKVQCRCAPPGCFCKKGLVKRADGKCVPPTECSVKPPTSWACSENAEFLACGSSCRPTCKNPYPAPCFGPCVKGCCCKSGFVEDSDGRCVLLINCHKIELAKAVHEDCHGCHERTDCEGLLQFMRRFYKPKRKESDER